MEYEMVEYEYLILDIVVAWRIYFKIFKNSSYHPHCFICLLNLKILIMIIKSYLLYIEFVQNELDPC